MLQLSRAVYDAVIAHCKERYPKEACGLLAGAGLGLADDAARVARACFVMRNVEDSPVGYAMDPKEQLTVMRRMREQGQHLLAIYHSHTASPAYPSAVDVSLAISPDISYVLVSLQSLENPDLQSYRIDGKTVVPEAVEVAP